MTVVRGIGRFLYDFIIGDDWKIAASTVVALALGLGLLAIGVPTSVAVVGSALAVAAAFTIALVIDVRTH
jgi:hypothetical protein